MENMPKARGSTTGMAILIVSLWSAVASVLERPIPPAERGLELFAGAGFSGDRRALAAIGDGIHIV